MSASLALLALALSASAGVEAAASSGSPRHPRHVQHRDMIRRAQAAAANPTTKPAGGFEIVGNAGVSGQMLFVGSEKTVFVLDKVENNAMTITTNGATHPAWGTRYDLDTNTATPMEVTTNTFCAGGYWLADGRWAVFGGNQPVIQGGEAVSDKVKNPTGGNPYANADGGDAIRLLQPCDDDSCKWQENGPELKMAARRWYPTVEGLADGSLIVLGGDHWGGFVSTFEQNEPSYEYWPKQPSGAIPMDFLNYTVPVNLYPLTWLMPSGKLFLQAAYKSILYDMDTKTETKLPDMKYAQRVYPASGAAVMLPLTPANNYEATILFCGGSAADISKSTDAGAGFNITASPADDSCVRINPDAPGADYVDDDRMPEGRSMGSLVYLPDGKLWLGNGVGMGMAGYGNERWSIGVSYGQDPIYMPAVYDPNAPLGSRFSRTGLSASTEERMYHSTAVLVADGSVIITGSNPNADVTTEQWGTKYSVEKWYPLWYNAPRPVPSTLVSKLSYGGNPWSFTYNNATMTDAPDIKVVVIRTGFATHGVNFGQRFLELPTSYTWTKATGEFKINVGQMPPNANVFTPGPAMMFFVVNGVPSLGKMVTVGTGALGVQPVAAASVLPKTETILPPVASNAVKNNTAAASPAPAVDSAADGKGAAAAGNAIIGTINDPSAKTSAAPALAAPLLSALLAVSAALVWA